MLSSGLLEDVTCNLCGSGDIRVLQAGRYASDADAADLTGTFSSSSDEPLSQQLVVCAQCGLQYVTPRLRADAVLEGYAAGADELFVSQARGRELTFAKCLTAIERVWRRPPGRLLDIGTGGGSFLHVASNRGWQVEGCEPNRWLCDWAQHNYGLRVRPGTVFEQHYQSNSCDVVTLWDVLEHTPDPKSEIREVRRLLADGGLIVVNYPDIGSWIARAMGRSWVFLLDVHLYYFTRATIRKLLEDEGFELVKVRPHFQRLGMGYVLRRAARYVGAAARVGEIAVKKVGLSDWQVPYWMGQTLVIARKLPRAD